MESHFSVSQSLQASVILQQQQHNISKAQLKQQQEQEQYVQKLKFWQQLKLTASLFGVESSTAFEQVYTYLSLQYLGVPVAFMATNGIVAGFSAVILILVVGHLIDRGSNPKKRKLFALLFGLLLFVSGCLILISACVLKIVERKNVITGAQDISVVENLTVIFDDGSISDLNTIPTIDYSRQADQSSVKVKNSSNYHSMNTTEDISQILDLPTFSPLSLLLRGQGSTVNATIRAAVFEEKYNSEIWKAELAYSERLSSKSVSDVEQSISLSSTKEAAIPLAGILGILGFICLDIGFDLGNPMCRAFIIEHSPSSQHTHLLITATQLASLAGLLMSLLGVFDLPEVIEATFGVDGTSGTFIFMLTVILIIVVSFFLCSIWTGISLRKTAICIKTTKTPSIKVSRSSEHMRGEKDVADDKAPLLLKPKQSANHNNGIYMSFECTLSSAIDTDIESTLSLPNSEPQPESHTLSQSHSVLEGIPEYPTQASSSSKSFSTCASELWGSRVTHAIPSGKLRKHSVNREEPHFGKLLESIDETVNTPLSFADTEAPVVSSSGGEKEVIPRIPSSQIGDKNAGDCRTETSPSSPKKPSLFNKRLVILVASSAFSVSSLIGIVMYSSNAVTLGIYGANPTAELGTPGNIRYRRGLRTAALGNVVFYISYFFSCLLNNKSYILFGEKVYNLICHGLIVFATAIMILTQRVEAYFVAMATLGPFRTCIFTLPYVLANQFTKVGEGPVDSTQVGRVTAIIGCALPCVYVVMSSTMGPLIDATGNVWVPLVWTCIGNSISMVIFSTLFFIKD